MSEEYTINDATRAILELTQWLKGNPPQDATVDWEKVQAHFEPQVEALVAARVKAEMDRQPVRGEPIGAHVPGDGVAELLKGNRYARAVRHMREDGFYRDGGQIVKDVDLYIARNMLAAQWRIKQLDQRMNGDEHVRKPSDDLDNALKALTSTGSATGDELVPEDLAATLWEDFFLASRVAGVITNIPMPTDPFNVPLGLGAITWRKGTETQATTASTPATAKVTLTTTEQVTEQVWSYTLSEDAAIAMAPALRARLAQSGAEQIDYCALNFDSTATATGNVNSDDAAPASDASYLSDGQDGIRHQWIVDNTNQTVDAGGDALADADLLGAFAKMGKYAVDPNRCVLVCDVQTYLKGFLDLDNVIGLDKFGPSTPILTGQLAAYRGFPIIISASHGLAMADGKLSATASNNTLGSLSVWNRDMWYMGFRRQVLVEVDRDIQRRVYLMVTSFREAVGAHGTRSSNTHTAGVINILV